MRRFLCAVLVMWGGAAQAIDLQLPANAQQITTRNTVEDRYFAPVGPFERGAVPTQQIDGNVARSAWRIAGAGITPLQLVARLKPQLEAAGFHVALDCAEIACGGYDFRFSTEVLPAPNMHVNIRNFHVLTALRGEGDAVSVLASASTGATFIQIIQAGGVEPVAVQAVAEIPVISSAVAQVGLAEELLRDGHAVLSGLDFNSGTPDLGEGPFADLQVLADMLEAQPDLRIALVGHTDNVGGLDVNIALSRSRASAVRTRLIDQYNVAPARLEAEGMGYLAPHTTNQTAQGREINRRVEAIVLSQ
ncbi:MAG: OmpA family protein [Sulfitobacter sp.]